MRLSAALARFAALAAFTALALGCTAMTPLPAQPASYPFTLISKVKEANPKVVAIAIDFGNDLPISWQLQNHFSVSAELLPVKSYAGDLIGNSAVAKAPRTILKAYTSARPEMGSPSQGRYAIIEMNADDPNAPSYYGLFNPGVRQVLPYQDKMVYDVKLLHDLNGFVPALSPQKPASQMQVFRKDASFRQAGARIATADDFVPGLLEMPTNQDLRFMAYQFYKPAGAAATAPSSATTTPALKAPLVVFLHGIGQSHDHKAFPNDPTADSLAPLLASQGGVTWVENAPEKAYVLVPQVLEPLTRDADGEFGWRHRDSQQMLLALVDKMIAENPAIDTDRLYLTGLSLGAMGSWRILTSPDPAISRKFAAAAVFNGVPTGKIFDQVPNETPAQKQERIVTTVKAVDFSKVAIPVWIGHSDTDPLVNRAGARVPFALLSGKGEVSADGQLQVSHGAQKSASPLVRDYQALNRYSGTEVRYTEYQFGNGDRFRDLGMATRNGHNTWETAYKDQAIIDWMFKQRRRAAP